MSDVERLESRLGGEREGSTSTVKRVALAAFVGSTVEWYDFFLYGTAAALVFGDLFFPDANPTVGTLAAFATFGVGFLFRPLGGAFFGHFGDRVGRKAMLVITLLLMGSATVAIGLLPTYKDVGLLAPILLVLLRAIQGFSVGGEWAGGSLMTIEYAPPERRGFYGAWPQVGPSAGSLLATGAFAAFNTLPEDQFNAWGWRVPFLLSAVVVIVGLIIRMRLAESPVFKEAKKHDVPTEKPFITAFRDHKRPIFLIMGMRLAINTTFYVATVFALSYGDDQLGIPKGAAAGRRAHHVRPRLRDEADLRPHLRLDRPPADLRPRLADRRAVRVPVLPHAREQGVRADPAGHVPRDQHLARPQRRDRVVVLLRVVRHRGPLHGRRDGPPARRRDHGLHAADRRRAVGRRGRRLVAGRRSTWSSRA